MKKNLGIDLRLNHQKKIITPPAITPSAPWTTADTPGITLLCRAKDQVGYSHNDLMPVFTKTAGTLNSPAQAVASKQPTYQVIDVNGVQRPVVYCPQDTYPTGKFFVTGHTWANFTSQALFSVAIIKTLSPNVGSNPYYGQVFGDTNAVVGVIAVQNLVQTRRHTANLQFNDVPSGFFTLTNSWSNINANATEDIKQYSNGVLKNQSLGFVNSDTDQSGETVNIFTDLDGSGRQYFYGYLLELLKADQIPANMTAYLANLAEYTLREYGF